MNIKISADSTCDLPKEFIQKHNIGIMPLYIIRDTESLRDGLDINTQDLFEYTKRTGNLCSTSAVTVADYITAWTEWRLEYDAVIHIGFSSGLSASFNNACIAAMEVDGVFVVDSLNVSTGFGHLVIDAALMAEEGKSPDEIVAEMECLLLKLDTSFVLDTLEYLRKGGRCTAIQALGANILELKPCIEMHDGKMKLVKKYRGKTEKAYIQYITDRLKGRDDIDLRRVFITDSGVPEEIRARLREAVLAYQPFEEIYSNTTGCTISGHCGPLCMGVVFYKI